MWTKAPKVVLHNWLALPDHMPPPPDNALDDAIMLKLYTVTAAGVTHAAHYAKIKKIN